MTHHSPVRYLLSPNQHAALVCYILTADSPASGSLRPDRIAARLTDEGTPFPSFSASRWLPSVTCGGWRPYASRLLVRGTPDESEVECLLDAVDLVVEQTDAESAVFPFVDEDDAVLSAALSARGYCSVESATRAYMPVNWQNLDAYLSGLPSKWRQTARRDLRALDGAGVEYTFLESLREARLGRLAVLQGALYRKYGFYESTLETETRLHTISELGEGLHAPVLLASLNEEIVGFVLMLTAGGNVHLRYAGFDYEQQGKLPLYFGLLFYEVARIAPRLGWQQLHYGPDSTAAKVSRGCQTARQFFFFRTSEH